MRTAIRYAVALLLGIACAFIYFMYPFPPRPQWIPIHLFLALISAALVLPSRLLGQLSLGVLLTYSAPVTVITLLLSLAKGFTSATMPPIAAVLAGASLAWALTQGLDRIARRIRQRGDEVI
jgi:hypothetical protein